MCGRARCTLNPEDVSRACGIDGSPKTLQLERYSPSYNVSPGFYLPVLRKEQGSQASVLHCMKWGLVPSFTKKSEKPDHFKMFNARSESVCEKASFRRLVPNNRCLVAVEGFYEWKKDGSKKQPYYIHFRDNRPLVFAALYDLWEGPEGEVLYTFTILTTCCSSSLQWLHDRMPVILGNKDTVNAWLNSSPSSKIDALLRPYKDSDLAWYPVTPAMGKPSFNGAECIKEIQLKPENSISKFFSKAKDENYNKSEPCIKSLTDSHVHRGLSGNQKEELGIVENKEVVVKPEAVGEDTIFESSSLQLSEGAGKCGTKRAYQRLADDSDIDDTKDEKPWKTPPAKESPHLLGSPMKKKGNPKSEGGKQPTLFSYFGKS